MAKGERHVPLEEKDPATVRVAILARSSDNSAKPEDMAGQVQECQEFIARMGWPPAPEAYIFTEAKTGTRSVVRPVIDEVLALAQRGAIDVIVCREWERVARVKARRYQITMTAADFGVEFRYANLAKDGGKMPDTLEARIVRDVLEELGQAEAEKIKERTGGGKRRRMLAGLPDGGRGGVLYGYAPGERRLSHGRPAGCLTWVIDDSKAQWVRWLVETVAETDPADLSIPKLARELERRGAPTVGGGPHWDTTRVRAILQNPKYCGRGRTGRFVTEWSRERDAETGQVYEIRRQRDRLRTDPDGWQEHTEPLSADAIPALVTPELWDRMQAIRAEAAALHNRGGPRRTDPLAHSTLLDGGFVRCICGNKMTRFWHTKLGKPYYHCNRGADMTVKEHRHHSIAAADVDALILATLAQALTDPDEVLQIADAAETARREAEADLAVAIARDTVTAQRLTDLTTEQEHVVTALTALAAVPNMELELTRLRTRLTALDQERSELLTLQQETRTVHSMARTVVLRSLFTARDLLFHQDGTAEELDTGSLMIGPRMTTWQAAAFLGLPPDSDLGMPVQTGEPFSYEGADGTWETGVEADMVLTADVLLKRLQQLPRTQLRRLLRAHGVQAPCRTASTPVTVEYVRAYAGSRARGDRTPREPRIASRQVGINGTKVTFMILADDLNCGEKVLWLVLVWMVPVIGPLLYLLLGQRQNRVLAGYA